MFGGWSIDKSLYDWLVLNLESNKVILELGSGLSTKYLCENWKVYSVEESEDWINKSESNYIFAPIVNDYYDLKLLSDNLPVNVDCILVDGPAYGNRARFHDNINIFLNLNPSIIVFDDVDRKYDYELYIIVKDYLINNSYDIESDLVTENKQFAYIKIKR